MLPYFVQPGQRFGRGVVVDPEVKVTLDCGNTYRAARLKCDCGNEYTAYIFNIRSGNTRSCGCLARETRRETSKKRAVYGRSARAQVFSAYRRNAKRRGYVWELKDEDFNHLTSSSCFYCGSAPSNIRTAGAGFGGYVYNGIDRVNNTMGYVLANCVPCCRNCNVAKNTMSLTDFDNWLDRVVSFRSKRNTSTIPGI